MRTLCIALAVAIGLLAGAQAGEPARIDGIAHVAFRVSDLQRARDFWQKLGFEESFAFTKGDQITQVFVKVNDRQFIELYPRNDPAEPLGWLHVCFETDAAEALHALYEERALAPTPLVKGGAGNFIFSLNDPAGRQIEVTQYLPGSRHSVDAGQHLGADRIADELHVIRTGVPDLAAAQKFYGPGLGFAALKAKSRLRVSGDQRIELKPAASAPQFVFRVSSTKAAAERLRQLGLTVKVRKHVVLVADPDGNIMAFRAMKRGK